MICMREGNALLAHESPLLGTEQVEVDVEAMLLALTRTRWGWKLKRGGNKFQEMNDGASWDSTSWVKLQAAQGAERRRKDEDAFSADDVLAGELAWAVCVEVEVFFAAGAARMVPRGLNSGLGVLHERAMNVTSLTAVVAREPVKRGN